jgi:hypothetical protein
MKLIDNWKDQSCQTRKSDIKYLCPGVGCVRVKWKSVLSKSLRKEKKMSESKKGKKREKTSASDAAKQGRRQFLRGAGVMGAGAAIVAAGLGSQAKAQSADDRLTLDVQLDSEKIAAIQKCLANGTLRISMSKVAATTTKPTDPWLYD